MTTSEFARKALGIESVGAPLKQSAGCMFCGRKLCVGEIGTPFEPSKNFMDDASLAHRAQPGTLCGDCAALGTKMVMMATQNCLITAEGIFSLASSAAKKHLLLHPPEPPFAVCFSDTTLQHLIWRTPMSLCHEIIHLRISSRLFRMSLSRVREAHGLCTTLRQKAGFAEASSPLLSLDYHWRSLTSAYLHPAIESAATVAELKTFCRLTPGDWWGVGILLMQTIPQAPPKVRLRGPATGES